MLITARFFGAFPLTKKQNNFELSTSWIVYSIIVGFVQILYALFRLQFLLKNPNVRLYHAVLSVGHYFSCAAIIIAGAAVVLKNRRGLNRFCYNVTQVQRMMKNFERENNTSRNKAGLYLTTYLLLVFAMKFYVRQLKPTFMIFLEEFAALSCHLGVIGSALVFSAFVGMLEEELGTLNRTLLEATRNTDVHYLLSTTGEELNECFYQSYFVIICGSVWSVTSANSSTAYNLISTEDYYEAALQFMWMVFWFFVILVTVMPCSSAVNFSKTFNYELSLYIIQGFHSMEQHSGDREKLKLHVDFDFTVCFSCGFFQLDRTLIYAIIGNVSSFAVILVQVAIIQ